MGDKAKGMPTEGEVTRQVEVARKHCAAVLERAGVDGTMLATAIMVWEARKLAEKGPDLDRPYHAAAPSGQLPNPALPNAIWLHLTMQLIGRYWQAAQKKASLEVVLEALWIDTFYPVHVYEALVYMLSGGMDPAKPGALLNARGAIILEALRNPVASPTVG